MRRSTRVKALAIAAFAAVVPAVTAAVVIIDLDAASREDLFAAGRKEWWALTLGLVVLVGGVWWIMRGGLNAHDQASRRLAAAARTAATANPRHRADHEGVSDGHAEATAALNALASKAEEAERTVDQRVAEARSELAAERDRLAAVLADLDLPVMVCTPGGMVLLLNDAARHACGENNYLGVGRSVFSVLDRDDLSSPVQRALRGERVEASVRCGHDNTIDFRVGPVTEQGRFSGFVLVGPTVPAAEPSAEDAELHQAGLLRVDAEPMSARPAPRPVIYDFRLLDLDS